MLAQKPWLPIKDKGFTAGSALGEMFLWTAAAFLLNSPFLALMSSIYYPSFRITMWMEEQDLILRFRQKYVDYIQRTGFIFPKRKARV
jgi:protein-S-isoprenylcysteine O-methyltransferase Ste14